MIITKSMFIEYLRCRRFSALEKIYKKKDIDPYERERYYDLLGMIEIVSTDTLNEEELVLTENEHLKMMLPYFNQIEIEVGKKVEHLFKGTTKYGKEIKNQQKYQVEYKNYQLLCYVDIYNELNDNVNIIEVKATTTNKFMSLGFKEKGILNSIFEKGKDGILYLKEEIDEDILTNKKYLKHRAKLLNREHDCGSYVYDLAFQRFIIERFTKNENIKYYLGVLNHEYIFDGRYEGEEPLYTDELTTLIDLTNITKELSDRIRVDIDIAISYIEEDDSSRCKIGNHCKYKKMRQCKYFNLCFDKLPKKNSLLTYINNHHGFKDSNDVKHDRYELINDGSVHMQDIPKTWLHRRNNQIQRDVIDYKEDYYNIDKIRRGIAEIKYPIYHLDFESFPCPLPRFKGEKPYMQSLFQFSLHIERSPGVCDKEKDHYEFLAKDHKDYREEFVKKMCEYIKDDNGSIMVFNETFEKSRINELAIMYPKYKNRLYNMLDRIFDLMYLVKTNNKFYQSIGFPEESAKEINYYHEDLQGSFSIKKVLPVFSDLSYKDMIVGNGMEAVYTYMKFPTLTSGEYIKMYNALIEYCKQDTWAMVEILDKIRVI